MTKEDLATWGELCGWALFVPMRARGIRPP